MLSNGLSGMQGGGERGQEVAEAAAMAGKQIVFADTRKHTPTSLEMKKSMDSLSWKHDYNSRITDSVGNKGSSTMSSADSALSIRITVLRSSSPLPDNVMIGIVGRPEEGNSNVNRVLYLGKQLQDMFKESEVILEKASFLKEQCQLALKDGNIDTDVGPTSVDDKNNFGNLVFPNAE